MSHLMLVVVFITAAFWHGDVHAQQTTPRNVLAKFAGTWDMTQDNVAGERQELAALIMGDRFVESQTWLPDNCFQRINTQMLMTYDEKVESYRAWISWSNGDNWEATGEWNEESQTMAWTAPTGTGTRVFKSSFKGDSKREWSIEDFDAEGKPGWSTKGSATRAIEKTP